MNCICCGLDAGYNRAVVDRVRGERVGDLCLSCEEGEFGETLRRTERGEDGCALCSRDGSYALPTWRPFAEAGADGALVSRVDYRVDAATAHLCDRHLRLLEGTEAASVAATVRAPPEHR